MRTKKSIAIQKITLFYEIKSKTTNIVKSHYELNKGVKNEKKYKKCKNQ